MATTPERPTYTAAQLDQYFNTIQLPPSRRLHSIAHLSPTEQLAHLTLLQKHQLLHVPFENLSLHYSPIHTISIDAEYLFKKIVTDAKGRGGYCMEANTLFGAVLRTLGYELYAAGARVHEPGEGWTGYGHMVHILTIGSTRYMIDVGFGANGPIAPLPFPSTSVSPLTTADSLDDSHISASNTHAHIPPASVRLVLTRIAPQTPRTPPFWVLQHRIREAAAWTDVYGFAEHEFLPQDYGVMNFYTSGSRRSFFTQSIIIAKFTAAEDKRPQKEEGEVGEIDGVVIMFQKGFEGVKRRRYGENESVVQRWEGEEHRIRAIKEWFGVTLDEDERQGIKGLASELPDRHE